MREVKHRRWVVFFAAVAFLVLAQVIWWNIIFMENVSTIEQLRGENAAFQAQGTQTLTQEKIQEEARRRRIMFLSESAFFVLLTCVAIYLLFRALKKEERSRQIQRNFIEIVSHESKTPLTALKLRLEALGENSHSDETKTETKLALDEVRRLTVLFDKVMSLNRVERRAFTFEEVNLSELVENVFRRLDPLVKANSIQLSLKTDSKINVRGDAFGLQNTIQSLVENAILYSGGEKSKIEVRLKRGPSSTVQLDIDDNGPGIRSTEEPHIFERFYRGHAGKKVPGTGLGLFIAKFIVEAHAGSIRLQPSVLGGTRFQIQLPRGGV